MKDRKNIEKGLENKRKKIYILVATLIIGDVIHDLKNNSFLINESSLRSIIIFKTWMLILRTEPALD